MEDTSVTLEEITSLFDRGVEALVEMLTYVRQPSDGNRAARKAIDRAHTAQESAEVKTIKLANLIDNSHCIVARDPDFAKVYLAEKAALLEVLGEGEGDPTLFAMAQ